MSSKILGIYELFLAHYGDLQWWPAKTPYEVMVGAVLTQNTAWSNVEKAVANFCDRLSPEYVADLEIAKLVEIIRPSGFFNQKAASLKAVTKWYAKYGYDVTTVQQESLEKLRLELLAIKGVGRETADSILLYSFGFASFVVDAYTMRLCGRYPIDTECGYEAVKALFEGSLPHSAKVYNNLHAMIVINAKNHCRKSPLCDNCPLTKQCGRNGL
ncbi:MAG: endonuclease [Dehalococcoidia bacterium]|nr:endonuclease [Dehalococcoidia bacterium]